MNEVVLKVEMTCEGPASVGTMTFFADGSVSRLRWRRFARFKQETWC